MNRLFTSVVLAAMLAMPAVAQEKFEIKTRKDVKGDVTKVTESIVDKGAMKISVMGQTMPKDEDTTLTSTYTEKLVEKVAGKKASTMERVYSKAEMTKDGNKITPSFVGKTVVIERNGKEFKFSVGGNELAGDEAAFLKEQFKNDKNDSEDKFEEIMFPKKALGVKETWKPDVATLVKELTRDSDSSLDIDAAKATAEGTFLKAYKKDGKQFGELEIVMTLPLKALGDKEQKVTLEDGSIIKLVFKFDGCIDGSTDAGKLEMSMDMKFVGSLKTPDGVEVKLEGTNNRKAIKVGELVK